MPSGTASRLATRPTRCSRWCRACAARWATATRSSPAPMATASRSSPDDVDAGRFERLAGEGRAHLRDGDPQRARRVLAEALALWRDVPLTGLSAPAFAPVVARLTDLRVAAVCDRVEADFALGHAAEVVAELEALAEEHPLHERLVAQLMTALYAAGRQADALADLRAGAGTAVGGAGRRPVARASEGPPRRDTRRPTAPAVGRVAASNGAGPALWRPG